MPIRASLHDRPDAAEEAAEDSRDLFHGRAIRVHRENSDRRRSMSMHQTELLNARALDARNFT